jgi:transposase InsO family protein
MTKMNRAGLIEALESNPGKRWDTLKSLGIPRATYYHWRKQYQQKGIEGLQKMKPKAKRIWNRLSEHERLTVLQVARDHPELSSRLLAVKITDERNFHVSESTVFRILKESGLIAPRPLEDMPAEKSWKHKTTRPDQIWQCDGTNFFVVGWGYYKGIPVQDDYSRKVLALPLQPDETSGSISDAVEQAIESAKAEGHDLKEKPMLLSDNGSGFIGTKLDDYLRMNGIKHLFGRPYHPQTQGKVEHLHKKIKQKVCLLVYCSPEELRRAIAQAVKEYNATPHEALKNVSPNDVYAGRRDEILKRRAEKKKLTLERRKKYNLSQPI